jgi:hypothetical protein
MNDEIEWKKQEIMSTMNGGYRVCDNKLELSIFV